MNLYLFQTTNRDTMLIISKNLESAKQIAELQNIEEINEYWYFVRIIDKVTVNSNTNDCIIFNSLLQKWEETQLK